MQLTHLGETSMVGGGGGWGISEKFWELVPFLAPDWICRGSHRAWEAYANRLYFNILVSSPDSLILHCTSQDNGHNGRPSMSTPLLFSSSDQTIFILDIPCSLELGNDHGRRILSAKALTEPFVTPEPRGKKREIFIATLPVEYVEYHDAIQRDIRRALQSIGESSTFTDWCLARVDDKSGGDELPGSVALDPEFDVDPQEHIPIILSQLRNDFPSERTVANELVVNPNAGSTQLGLSHTKHIFVPGRCTFMWSSIQRGLEIMQEQEGPSSLRFDMILMDPPWTNRSVRNGSKYATAEKQQSDPFTHALRLVEKHQQPDGHVAVWITNKASIRGRVLRSMTSLGFSLEEEWIWVKVTSKGEPVTPLDGVWRRPYEVLLIFRHSLLPCSPSRRFVFAVPDLHSRKPNLRSLFDTFFQPSNVLELFARNLTFGWWCLGDEVLKFQGQDSWCEQSYYANSKSHNT